MAKQQETTAFLSLDLIYTPKGLQEAVFWLTGKKQCPFAKPQQAAEVSLALLKARYKISSLRELRELDPDILQRIITELEEEENLERQVDLDSSSYIPPEWLRKHWEIEASKAQLKKEEIEKFVRSQNINWLNQIRERVGAGEQELPQAYRKENERLNSLFARSQQKEENLRPQIETAVEEILEKKLQEFKPEARGKIKETVLERIDYGFLSLQSEVSFGKSLEETIKQASEEIGNRTEISLTGEETNNLFQAVRETNRATEDIENILERTSRSFIVPSDDWQPDFFATSKQTTQEIVFKRAYALPNLEWRPKEKGKEKTSLKINTLVRKSALAPFAKPFQFLVNITPDNFQKANPALFYLVNQGITAADVAKIALEQKEVKTRLFFQELKRDLDLFESKHKIITFIFRNYFKSKKEGKTISIVRSSKRFSSIGGKILKIFKKTRLGAWLGKKSSKFLINLGLGSLTAGFGTLALETKNILKKVIKFAGSGYLGLLAAAAIKGTGALIGTAVGGFGGLIGGVFLGAEIGATIGVFGGPVGAIIGGGVGLLLGGIVGFIAGDWIQTAMAKSGGIHALESVSSIFSKATTATVSSLPAVVPATIVGTIVTGIVISQITSSAFVVPYSDRVSPWQGQSDYIKVEKSISFDPGNGNPVLTNPEKIENSDFDSNSSFIYQISVTAVGSKLTEVQLKDTITTSQEIGVKKLKSFSQNIADIEDGETVVLESYQINASPVEDFKDSILSNTAQIEATIEENGEREKSFKSTVLIIGDPPQDCPQGWPIDEPFYITQGPNGSYTHLGYEAIDLGYPEILGRQVRATHQGIVFDDNDGDSGKGRYIAITGTCTLPSGQAVVFTSYYAHLSAVFTPTGTKVTKGTPIGSVGNSGNSSGPHLHYEFGSPNKEIKMQQPFIPINVPRGDVCSETNHCEI